MPRPKGSKNKNRMQKLDSAANYRSAIAEKTAQKEELEQKVSDSLAQISELKAQLKKDRLALKSTKKAIGKLEAKLADAEARASLEAQRADLDSAVQGLLSQGVSMDEILHKLNG